MVVDGAENESSSFMVPDNVAGNISLASFQSFVGKVLKAKSACVEWCSLLGIANPEGYMIYVSGGVPKANILPNEGLSPFYCMSN